MNILSHLTKNNIDILKEIDREPSYIRDIADKLRISPGTVHNFVRILRANKLIEETPKKNTIIIRLNYNNPTIPNIKRLLNYDNFVSTKAYQKLKRYKLGIFGSYANGTNDNHSDLDIWIISDKTSRRR